MWPDRVSNLGPLTYESGALPTALRGPAKKEKKICTVCAVQDKSDSLYSYLRYVYIFITSSCLGH